MGEFVDLKAKPYNLSDEDVAWVEDTITGMSPPPTGAIHIQPNASASAVMA